jgi:hypothetical protein
MYLKMKELGWKENVWIQNIGIEDSKGNIILDKQQVLKNRENYGTALYVRQENLEVEMKRK